jgi:glycosidase
MVDRFANGDASNDAGADPADPQAFHGGDLAGVQAHLDHLVGLGVTDVWLTPVMSMRTEKLDVWGAYHGYWVQDPTRVEPRFGGDEALLDLRKATRDRGLGLWLDVVWNHVSFDAPLRTERPTWFHPSQPVEDWADPVQVRDREVHGLPDLAQENPEVRAWLTEVTREAVAKFEPDGLRVDAVRHMPAEVLRGMGQDLRQHRPGLRLLGEVFDGDPAALAQSWRDTGFDHVFDFPLRYALLDTVCHRRPAARLASVLSLDVQYADARKLYTFLDNHDTPRLLTECQGDVDRAGLALDVLFTLRGTPSITWGTESGAWGAGEPENRGDLRWEPHPLGERLRAASARRTARPELYRGETRVLGVSAFGLAWAQVDGDRAVRVIANLGDGPWIWGGRAWDPGVYVEAIRPPPAPVLTQVRLPAPTGSVLVGAGPWLGSWNPDLGVPVVDGYATLEVPSATVLAYKVVQRGEAGWIWPDGEDRYHWVPPAATGP